LQSREKSAEVVARRMMIGPMLKLLHDSLRILWVVRWDLARYAILFRLLEALVFTPLSALIGHSLSGRTVVDSTDLVGFVLSARGFSASFVAATLLLTIRLVEQAGLSAIALGSTGAPRVTPLAALRIVSGYVPRLLAIAGWILLAGLSLAIPLLVVAGFMAKSLLAKHDINYYLAERPPGFMAGAAVILVVALPIAAAAVWLAVRWCLVIPALLCERGSPRGLLHSSAGLVHGHWYAAATAWLMSGMLILGLGFLSAWIGRLCSLEAVRLAGADGGSHFGAFAVLLAVRTVLTGIVTLPGSCMSAGLFTALYCSLRRAKDAQWRPALIAAPADTGPRRSAAIGRWLLASLPVITCGLAVINTVVGMSELYADHPVSVTAHRGGTVKSIENTVAAIREAVDAGAQFAEIDVQMSRDEVLVVTHDSDFSRQAGVASKVWELTYPEIQAIPLTRAGSRQMPADRVPAFEAVLEAARGRIRLNIELKYYGDHQPRLAERVVEAVRAAGMADQVVMQSLHYAGLEEVRRLAPEIPVGYLFSVNAREPRQLDVDFLSVQIGRVNGPFVNAAHRRGQQVHVWTVDKPADMERMIDLGVDNLITNRPQDALDLVRAHADLSPPERTLHRLRAWLNE
jgi:glycerophosphoryl diester phosphodiesterase